MIATLGNWVRLQLESVDDNEQLYNPATITLRIKTPTAAESIYTYAGGAITRESLGVHWMLYKPGAVGHYYYRWEVTVPDKVIEGEFDFETIYL